MNNSTNSVHLSPISVTSLAGGGEEVEEVADMMDCKNRSGAVTHTSIPTADQHPATGTGNLRIFVSRVLAIMDILQDYLRLGHNRSQLHT